jgi:Adenylate and Guanylate cyclase catalytic domain
MSAFAISLTFATSSRNANNNDSISGEGWPTVTVPPELFFPQGASLFVPRYMDSYLLAPIVANDIDSRHVASWEAYSRNHSSEWIAAGLAYQHRGTESTVAPSFQQRHRHLADDGQLSSSSPSSPPYFAPIWQHYPVRPEWIDHDLASDASVGGQGLINATVFSDRRTVLPGRTLLRGLDGVLANSGGTGASPPGPLLPTLYPIADSPDAHGGDPGGTKVVGLLVGLTRWSQILSGGTDTEMGSITNNINSAPSSSTATVTSFSNLTNQPGDDDGHQERSPHGASPSSMVAVVVDVCSRDYGDGDDGEGASPAVLSFAIDATALPEHGEAAYLGPGDRHDPRYDSMGRTVRLGSGVASEGCDRDGVHSYEITLYPTAALERSHRDDETGRPWMYAVLAAAVGVVLLLAVLHSYRRGRRRHRTVSAEAVQARKVVESLFPSNVHDRLFQRTGGGGHGKYAQNSGHGGGGKGTKASGTSNHEPSKDRNGMKPADGINRPKLLPPLSSSTDPEKGRNHQECQPGDDANRTGGRLGPSSLSRASSSESLQGSFSSPAVLAVDALPCTFKCRGESDPDDSADHFRSGVGSELDDDEEEEESLNDEPHDPSQKHHPMRHPLAGPNRQQSRPCIPPGGCGPAASDADDECDMDRHKRSSSRSFRLEPPMQRLRNFLSDLPTYSSDHQQNPSHHSQNGMLKNGILSLSRHGDGTTWGGDEPIADLFPECTVMFADISGFTAWSSVREPAQVFKLLETIYQCFDRLAKKRGVFKVETIGDCYVRRIPGVATSSIARSSIRPSSPLLLPAISLKIGRCHWIAKPPERSCNCPISVC